MDSDLVISLAVAAMELALKVALPLLLVGLAVGLVISVFQATTQIQEQTLTFAPKMVAVFGILAIMGAWIGSQLVRFTFHIFDQFPVLIAR